MKAQIIMAGVFVLICGALLVLLDRSRSQAREWQARAESAETRMVRAEEAQAISAAALEKLRTDAVRFQKLRDSILKGDEGENDIDPAIAAALRGLFPDEPGSRSAGHPR